MKRASLREHRLFWAVVVLLALTHVDAYAIAEPGEKVHLWLGWLPDDVLFHCLWIAIAAGVVMWMTGRIWAEPEPTEGAD